MTKIGFAVTVAVLAGCRSPMLGIEVGPAGVFEGRVVAGGRTVAVEGRDGGLFVNGEPRGELRAGDWVTVDWDGDVRVNGERR